MSTWSTQRADGRREYLGTAEAGDLYITAYGNLPGCMITISIVCNGQQVFFAACAQRDVRLSNYTGELRLRVGECIVGLDNETTRGACAFLGIPLPPEEPERDVQRRHDSELGALIAPLSPLDPPVSAPPPPAPIPLAGGSNPSLDAEHDDMSEKQVADHPVLRACARGHRPRMYEATGNLRIAYYVECHPCGIRTARVSNPERAATEWNTRATMPILYTAAA